MKNLFLFLITIGLVFVADRSDAQTFYYSSAVPVPRYNVIVPVPTYRHYEDIRRYNAAPNRYGYRGPEAKNPTYTRHSGPTSCACQPPVKIRTEIVSQQCRTEYYYDKCGRRMCRNITVTFYKDIYSNGGCRLWQKISR